MIGVRTPSNPDHVELLMRINIWRIEHKINASVKMVAEEEEKGSGNEPTVTGV
jgi:hypothetical protein